MFHDSLLDLQSRVALQRKHKESVEAHSHIWASIDDACKAIGASRRQRVGRYYYEYASPESGPLLKLGAVFVSHGVADWALAQVDCSVTKELLAIAINGDQAALEERLLCIDPRRAGGWEEDVFLFQLAVENSLVQLRRKWDRLPACDGIQPADAKELSVPTILSMEQAPPATPSAGAKPKATKIDIAIGLLPKHPDWTDAKMAETVGCTPANLSGSKRYQAARNGLRDALKRDSRQGKKNLGSDMDLYED